MQQTDLRSWVVVRVRSGGDRAAENAIRRAEFSCYFPVMSQIKRFHNHRAPIRTLVSAFPGYGFVPSGDAPFIVRIKALSDRLAIMMYDGHAATVKAGEIARIRVLEEGWLRLPPPDASNPFKRGDLVCADVFALSGLVGTVVSCSKMMCRVTFGTNAAEMKIRCFLLRRVTT